MKAEKTSKRVGQKRTPKKDAQQGAQKGPPKPGAPVQRRRPGRRAVKPWRDVFLDQLRKSANVLLSCKAANVARSYAYETREQDPAFARLWDAAVEEAIDLLEKEAWRRAVTGVTKPVFGSLGQGKGTGEVGAIQEYSDTLLIFLMKGGRPQKYRERVDHSGNFQHSEVVVYLPDNGRGDAGAALTAAPANDQGSHGDGNPAPAQTS